MSRIPNAAATIIPFDVESRVRELEARPDDRAVRVNGSTGSGTGQLTAEHKAAPVAVIAPAPVTPAPVAPAAPTAVATEPDRARSGVQKIGSRTEPGKATVEGRVVSLAIRPVEQNSVLAIDVSDGTGTLTALFYGRKQIPGVIWAAPSGSTARSGSRATGR